MAATAKHSAPATATAMLALVAVVALTALASVSAHGHKCMHDEMMEELAAARAEVAAEHEQLRQEAGYNDMEELDGLLGDKFERRLLSTYGNIRIHLVLDKLTSDPGFKCNTEGSSYYLANPAGAGLSAQGTCTAGDVLTPEKKAYLSDVILQQAVAWFSSALQVVPLTENLVVRPHDSYCNSYHVDCCKTGAHGSYMPSKAYTTGYANTDYVLFVTARPTPGSVIAWALACDQDISNGRPIAGHANFGPALIDTSDAARHNQVATAIHEIAHAFGFSSGLFPYFVEAGGTKRLSKVTTSFNERGGWVTKITTPNVVAAVKEHFQGNTDDCTSWASAGGELENGGGSGTAGSHWEKRIFMNEFMTGTLDKNVPSVYSKVSLALFEDTGWYQVNYDVANTLPWGKGEGCGFASNLCSTWSDRYFCTERFRAGCTPDRAQRAFCNFYEHPVPLQGKFQYFPHNENLGGELSLPDYCPVYGVPEGNNCRDEKTTGYYFYGEVTGLESRCFDGNFVLGTSAGSVFSQHHAACLSTSCDDVTKILTIKLKKYKQTGYHDIVCPRSGGTVDVGAVTGGAFVGDITCPPASDICTGNPCENNLCNGHGTCRESDGTCSCDPGYYGSDNTGTKCDRVSCPTSAGQTKECGDHGTCLSDATNFQNGMPGTCKCDVGYRGTTCEEIGCPNGPERMTCDASGSCVTEAKECDGNGDCLGGSGICKCHAGFIGNACAFTQCPSVANATCSNHGTCDGNYGYCTCDTITEFADGGLKDTMYYAGDACQTLVIANQTERFPLLSFTGEKAGNSSTTSPVSPTGTYQPYTFTLKAQQYQYMSFNVESVQYPVTLQLYYSDKSADPQMVACYAQACSAPSLTDAQFFVTGSDRNNGSKQIQFTPASNSLPSSSYDRAGRMLVAIVSEKPTDASVSIVRDSCAALECVHGDCIDGACRCDTPPVVGKYGKWSGALCDAPDCPGTPDCGDFRGQCVVDTSVSLRNQFGSCQCNTGFEGNACGDTLTSGFQEMNATQPVDYTGSLQMGAAKTFFFAAEGGNAVFVRLRSKTAGADPILLGQAGTVPPMKRTVDTVFDERAWVLHSPNHTISTAMPSTGIFFVTVANGRYSTASMDYTVTFEVAKSCPSGLNNCNGHGTCGTTCLCHPGYEGTYCQVPVPTLTAGVNSTATVNVGEWKYFTFEAGTSVAEVHVTLTGSAARAQPLLMVGVTGTRRANNLGVITAASAMFDYDGYSTRSSTQKVRINRKGYGFYYIGVHNTRHAAAPVNLQVKLETFAAPAFSGSNCLNSTESRAACSKQLCAGRGQYNQDSAGNPFCVCQSGWSPTSYCNTPRFASFANLLDAAQNVGFLCNLCEFDVVMGKDELRVYKIPQPLQKQTGLHLMAKAANNSAGNPSMLVSQYLPRSLADFTFVSSSNSANESITITSQSPTGRYWLAVYANQGSNYTVTASRETVKGTPLLDSSFLESLYNWVSTTNTGMITAAVGGGVVLLLCLGCCCQICSHSGRKNVKKNLTGLSQSVRFLRNNASSRFGGGAAMGGTTVVNNQLNLELQQLAMAMRERAAQNNGAVNAQRPASAAYPPTAGYAGGGSPSPYPSPAAYPSPQQQYAGSPQMHAQPQYPNQQQQQFASPQYPQQQ